MSSLTRSWLFLPVHAAALATSSKSFRDNPILGSAALNQRGLHVARMVFAARMAAWRRRRLAHLVSREDAAAFDRDGFILKPNFLLPATFEALKQEIMSQAAPAREMRQGDAITRRIALNESVFDRYPTARSLVTGPEWLGLVRYVGASAVSPLTYVQTICTQVDDKSVDPQTRLHADTFHSSVKAFLFLTDVAMEDGPFVYAPGSHQLTPRRLAWERKASVTAAKSSDFQASRGSLRITQEEILRLGFRAPRAFAVPANTLIIADTLGFHARGKSLRPSVRVELWGYARRNPFIPWTGFDPIGLPFVKDRAIQLAWALGDAKETLGLGRNTWRPVGLKLPQAPAAPIRQLD
jgi:hypothetical protein